VDVSVYVDDMRAPFKDMLMCHMTADSTDELLAMADRIGVKRKWIQYPGTAKEHFDICWTKRKLSVKAGAEEVTKRELALRQQRKGGEAGPQMGLFGESSK